MGKNIDKVCEECPDKPLISGRRWADHCNLVHQLNSKLVSFTLVLKTEQKVTPNDAKSDGSIFGGSCGTLNIADRLSQPVKKSPNIHEQDSLDNETINVEQSSNIFRISHPTSRYNECKANSNSTQPTGNDGLFQSLRKTKQQELEEKILFLEGKVTEIFSGNPDRSHFTISDLASGVGSANKLTQEDFNKMYMLRSDHDQIIADKDKQLGGLKDDKNRLQEKMEMKDNDLLQLRATNSNLQGELSGLNIVKSLLKEKEDEIKKLNAELIQINIGSPINHHKQCEALELQLRQQLKESEELSQATFNRLNQRIEELKARLKKVEGKEFEESESETEQTQMHVDSDDQLKWQVDVNMKDQENGTELTPKTQQKDSVDTASDKIKCNYCACITSKPLGQHWKECGLKLRFNEVITEYGKQWKQPLTEDQFTHISEYSKFKDMFIEFCGGLGGDELASVQQLQEDLLTANSNNMKDKQPDDNSSSRSDMNMIDTTQHNYQTSQATTVTGSVGLADGSIVYGTNATRPDLKKQRLQPPTNEYNLFDGPLEQPGLYRSRWKDLQREADNIYINPQSVQQQVNLMNLKRRAKNTSLDRAAQRQVKRDNGVLLTLEEKRAEQEVVIKEQFQGSKDVTLKTENWLKSLSQCQSNADFQKLGDPICDAIILPEVPLILGTGEDRFTKMKVFLLDFKVPVKYVGKAVRDGCVFIQLQDHDNKFTVELLEKLRAALNALRKDVKAALRKQKKTKEECIEEEIEDIYIKQIDYTQDLIGFFMSLTSNIFDDLRDFSKLLNMEYSREYTQLRTSFQFEEKCLLDSGKLATINRLKIYNKLVHLWTSGQFKKWLNMNSHKIFNADQAFYFDKILPGMIEGLSRIEHSLYFYNKADQDEILFDVKNNFTDKLIDPVIAALNTMKGTFRYDVPFPMFVDTYFRAAATKSILLSFQADLWAIAFSHSERSYCFTGHKANRTKHSGTMLDFIKRFVSDKANMRIFIGDKMYDNIQKRGVFMQLPISSLNESHSEQYNFKLDSHFKYALSRQDLDTIQIISDDVELLQLLGIQRPAQLSKRELKIKEKEDAKNKGILVEHLLETKRIKSKRYFVYKEPSTDQCMFYTEDTRGRTYQCEHCNKRLERRGKGRGQLYLM